MKSTYFILFVASLFIVSGLSLSCGNKAATGAGIGALIGAGIGQAAGRNTESTLIGAGVGAGAGYLIGSHEENKEVRQNPDSFTEIEFTNSDGTTTKVALRKANGGYIGPQGEYYEKLPTQSEMKKKYGH
jgi:outer membrane lipoprotein SlyB